MIASDKSPSRRHTDELAALFNRAIIAYFGSTGRADAQEVAIAAAAVMASYVAAVADPTERDVLMKMAFQVAAESFVTIVKSYGRPIQP